MNAENIKEQNETSELLNYKKEICVKFSFFGIFVMKIGHHFLIPQSINF